MQMDAVIASILPTIGERDPYIYEDPDDASDSRRRGPRARPRLYAPRDDQRPLHDKTYATLAEMYTKLTLEKDHRNSSESPRTISDTTVRVFRKEYRRTVEVRTSFLKVMKIDTRNQKYEADVYIQAKWEEPLLDGRSVKDLEDFAIDSYWNPEIYIPNLSGAPDREETWCDVEAGENHPVVVWKKRIKGVFNERLELEDFPFDIQELQLKVASRLTDESIHLVEDRVRMSTVSDHNMVDHSEWKLYSHVDAVRCIVRNKLPTAKHHHPCISFMCSARRIPTFYFFNIFFMMFLLCSLVFCTLGIPAKLYEERLKVNIVLLLSVVAMKYVATNFYPVDLAYLTYMDIYNLLCVVIVTLMAIQNTILSIWAKDAATLAQADEGSAYVVLAVFLLVHVIAIITAFVVLCRGRYDLSNRDKEYHAEQKRRRAAELGKPIENGKRSKHKRKQPNQPVTIDQYGLEDRPQKRAQRNRPRDTPRGTPRDTPRNTPRAPPRYTPRDSTPRDRDHPITMTQISNSHDPYEEDYPPIGRQNTTPRTEL